MSLSEMDGVKALSSTEAECTAIGGKPMAYHSLLEGVVDQAAVPILPHQPSAREGSGPVPVRGGAWPKPDPQQIERFLELLGKTTKTARLRAFFPTGDDRKAGDSGRKGPVRLEQVEQWQAEGRGVYVVINDGGDSKAQITTCRALFCEWDDKPIEWQVTAWRELGLPEPSLMVTTGGKSVHCYWVLNATVAPDAWEPVQQRLLEHAAADLNIKDLSRVMRLPGCWYMHPGTQPGAMVQIIHESGKRYGLGEIAACMPAPEPATPPPPPASAAVRPIASADQPRTHEELERLVSSYPTILANNDQRDEALRLVCGLARCMELIGKGKADAIALASRCHPQAADTFEGVERWQFDQFDTGSFINQCKAAGVDVSRHDLKRSAPAPLTPPPAQTQKPPASLQALIQRLEDGWTEKGEAKALSAGRLAEMLPANSFRFNELDLRAYVNTTTGWQRITDADLDSAYVVLTGKGWRIGADPVVKAVLHVARQTTVHPVREYLQRLKADPSITPYDLDQVAPQLFRASNPLHVAMVRKWLIGAVARAMKPGCQMDYCLVLKGAQGLLKSTALKALAGAELFTSSHAEQDKDFLLNVHSCWVYELAELESITAKRKAGALKNLITTATDVFRPPYGRTAERADRQSVFCGTVNKQEFLRDDTGNRRFWVVPVEGTEKLNRDAITAARDAIWKAAVQAHEAGELPMLSDELEALSAAQNEQYNEQDAWAGMVRAWMDGEPLRRWDPDRDPSTTLFDPAGAFSSAEILYSAGLKRPDAINRADEMRLGEVLRAMGFTRSQQKIGGRNTRLWRPSQPSLPVPTSNAQVGTGQNDCSTSEVEVPSQPSLPKKVFGRLKTPPSPATAAPPMHSRLETQGRDGWDGTSKPVPAQSVCPVPTLLSEVGTEARGWDAQNRYEKGDLVEFRAPDSNWRNGFRVFDVVTTSAGTRYRIESSTGGFNVTADQIRLEQEVI